MPCPWPCVPLLIQQAACRFAQMLKLQPGVMPYLGRCNFCCHAGGSCPQPPSRQHGADGTYVAPPLQLLPPSAAVNAPVGYGWAPDAASGQDHRGGSLPRGYPLAGSAAAAHPVSGVPGQARKYSASVTLTQGLLGGLSFVTKFLFLLNEVAWLHVFVQSAVLPAE